MGQSDNGIGLIRYLRGGFEGAVAAPDYEHMTPCVLFGIDHSVNYFLLILPFHFQPPRRSPSANGEQNRGCWV